MQLAQPILGDGHWLILLVMADDQYRAIELALQALGIEMVIEHHHIDNRHHRASPRGLSASTKSNRLSIVTARTLKAGGDVPLPGIGKLKASLRAARTGRNPATGQAIQIPAKAVVKLTLNKAMDEAINR